MEVIMATLAPNRSRFRTARYSNAQPIYSTTGNLPAPIPQYQSTPVSPINSIFAGNDTQSNEGGGEYSDDENAANSGVSAGTGRTGSYESEVVGNNIFGGKDGIVSYENLGRVGGALTTLFGGPVLGTALTYAGRNLGKAADEKYDKDVEFARTMDQFTRDNAPVDRSNETYEGPNPSPNFNNQETRDQYGPASFNEIDSNQSGTTPGGASQGNPGATQNEDYGPESYNEENSNTGSGGPGSGNSSDDEAGGGAAGTSGGPGDGYAVGGRIQGPGGPTDDQVPIKIKASNGEYMLSDAQLSAMAQELFNTPDPEMMRDYLDQFSEDKTGQTPNNAGGEDGFDDDSMQHEAMEMLGREGYKQGGVSALRDISAKPSQMPQGMKELDETQQKIAQSLPMSATPQELSMLSQHLTPEVIEILGKALGPNMAYMLQPVANVGANMQNVNRPMITDTGDRMGGIPGKLPPMGSEALRGITAR